jgi:hypothetical protein
VSKPAPLPPVPQTDGDTDKGSAPAAETPPAKPSAGGFFGRVRNWVVGLFSTLGVSGVGALTDWKLAALLLAFLLLCASGLFLIALWLFGKRRVADWVSRHIA